MNKLTKMWDFLDGFHRSVWQGQQMNQAKRRIFRKGLSECGLSKLFTLYSVW